jgi:hypothetical protein
LRASASLSDPFLLVKSDRCTLILPFPRELAHLFPARQADPQFTIRLSRGGIDQARPTIGGAGPHGRLPEERCRSVADLLSMRPMRHVEVVTLLCMPLTVYVRDVT